LSGKIFGVAELLGPVFRNGLLPPLVAGGAAVLSIGPRGLFDSPGNDLFSVELAPG
jgi:hypothetical protein